MRHPSTLFHNPQCSSSRKAMELLRAHGLEPQIFDHHNTPPGRQTLAGLIARSGRPAHDFVRSKETLCAELGLDAPSTTDAQRIDALLAHPRLLERPIVVTHLGTPLGTRLVRPLEDVLEILSTA